MAKKKNSRKALAAALGIMGIAGLSVASASQLTVTPGNEVAMGTSAALFASCDDAVGISYDYNTSYEISAVTITGVAAACDGQDFTFSIANVSNSGSPVEGSSTFALVGTGDAQTQTVTVTSGVSIQDDLGAATVVIG